jgi:hypothetical protein
MKKFILPFLLLTSVISLFGQTEDEKNRAAQEAERKKKLEATMGTVGAENGWARKGAIGLDLGQLFNLNPYLGSGSNRLGLGGALGFQANYKKDLMTWKNNLLINLSTQKIGSGLVASGSDVKAPFEKALDLLNFNSNWAYQIKEGSKWAYSFDFGLLSQLLPSYLDSSSKKLYLKDIHAGPYNTSVVSKFFSPATITAAPGMKYVHDSHLNFFLSPVAVQLIYIADKNIANLGIHGTKLKDNSTTEYNQSKLGLGALAKVAYNNTFLKRFNFNSDLGLFSDYLDNPQNIDVVWLNSLSFEILKGFNFQIRGDAYYDDNKFNQITDADAVGGVKGIGKRVNIIEQILITYNRNF